MNTASAPETVRDQPMAVISIDEAIAKVREVRMVVEHMYPADRLQAISELTLGNLQFDPSQGSSMVPLPAKLAASALVALNSLHTAVHGPSKGAKFSLIEPKEAVDNCVASRVKHPRLKGKSAYNLTWLEEHSCLLMPGGTVVFRTVQPVLVGNNGTRIVVLAAHLDDFTKILTSSKHDPTVLGAMGGGVVLSNLLVQEVEALDIKQFVARHTMAKPDTSILTVLQIIGTGDKASRWSPLSLSWSPF